MPSLTSSILNDILSQADIAINGKQPWDVQIHDERFYDRVWRDKSLGLGESYMDGWWDSHSVHEFMTRLLCVDILRYAKEDLRRIVRVLPALLLNRQSTRRARMIARHHYDLGNDLFSTFLDPYMQYSCGLFDGTTDLHQAQLNKLGMICAKLELSSDDHLLDIGCGWGGLAKYAAEHHGCRVTGVNISSEQLVYARNFCRDLPVDFVDCDYRSIKGQFNKIVSVGMFEHVGARNYQTYFDVVKRCLKPDGLFLLHTIGKDAFSKQDGDPWILKYIFPNGELPTAAHLTTASQNRFVIEDWHNIGPHYDKTLMTWHARFQGAWPKLQGEKYDARFKRMWDYYLQSCAAAFRARRTQVWQVLMTAAGSATPQPRCRPYQPLPS